MSSVIWSSFCPSYCESYDIIFVLTSQLLTFWMVSIGHLLLFFIAHQRPTMDIQPDIDLVSCILQECGPRFTLKLISLQHGTFDTKGGEYEWVHKVILVENDFFFVYSFSTGACAFPSNEF